MKSTRFLVGSAAVLAAVTFALAGGCGKTDGNGPRTAANITISGKLTGSRAAATLTGYELYCATLATPPASATGTLDSSGNVSLSLAAASTPFSCFLLDTAGHQKDSVVFSGGTEVSQGALFAGDADLGTVPVTGTLGVAQATLPAGGSLVTSTPTGLDCPVGIWKSGVLANGGVSSSDPCVNLRTTELILKDPGGNLKMDHSYYFLDASGKSCLENSSPVQAFQGTEVAYSAGTLALTLPSGTDPGCAAHTLTFTGTVSADCQTITYTDDESGCGDCNASGSGITNGCEGCGTTHCPPIGTFSVTRQ
jgi:hypothetical protein